MSFSIYSSINSFFYKVSVKQWIWESQCGEIVVLFAFGVRHLKQSLTKYDWMFLLHACKTRTGKSLLKFIQNRNCKSATNRCSNDVLHCLCLCWYYLSVTFFQFRLQAGISVSGRVQWSEHTTARNMALRTVLKRNVNRALLDKFPLDILQNIWGGQNQIYEVRLLCFSMTDISDIAVFGKH